MTPDDPIQRDHEQRIAALERARHDLEDAVIVMSGLESRQSAMLKEHSELIVEHERWYARMQQMSANMRENLAEIGHKLDGLIGWGDGTI
jgi:hypothetical protein